MSEQPEVVERIDALMRRRRSFVAQPAGSSEPIVESPARSADDEIPVLTEIVAPEPMIAEPQPGRIDENALSLIAAEIADAVRQQLAVELPSLLEATLAKANEELRTGIMESMDCALRQVAARRRQLRLPLEPPEDDPFQAD